MPAFLLYYFIFYYLQFIFYMLELDMEIKCNLNPNYFSKVSYPRISAEQSFRGHIAPELIKAGKSADIFVKRPVASVDTSATGLFSGIKEYLKAYKKNIVHTYEHKVVFALIEKELFGKNSKDSITHDADKLLMYILGFPRSFVSKFHRNISEHHTDSGKNMNIRSMICDNIASSPEFKPEKKRSLRDHYAVSPELQNVKGFGELLERYNYGENLDFNKINEKKEMHTNSLSGILRVAGQALSIFLFANISR